jgi:hypothetical protein
VNTLFKSAREDEVIAEDTSVSVKSAHNKATSASKRSFTLDELRAVLDVADPEWKSMIFFGLYMIWRSRQVPNNTAIGIYGYCQLTPIPQIDAIAFILGSGVPLAQFWLDAVYSDQQANVGYFDPPVVFSPLQTLQVNLLASAAVGAAGEAYGLLGFVAEPAGQTVSPDQANLV